MKQHRLIDRGFSTQILSGILLPFFWSAYGATITYTDLNPSGATSSGAFGVCGAQQVGYAMIAGQMHAALWQGSANSFVDLHPSGASYSIAKATTGQSQVGFFVSGNGHAALWFGTPGSLTDLNDGFASSEALGVSATQQVGNANFGTPPQAVLWSGPVLSHILIHPAGASASFANGISGGQQVGYVSFGSDAHAVIWSGSSNSCVDLHPAGATRSEGNATTGLQQAGTVWTQEGNPHAALWSGNADSFVDLNPAGASGSGASAIYGAEQAGYAQVGGRNHAALWVGSSESFLNLHLALGTNYTDSQATGIDKVGSITQVVGYATTTAGAIHAIMWTISRPPTLALTSIQSFGKTNVLSFEWNNGSGEYILEGALSMSAIWSDVPASLETNGSQITAMLTNNAPQQFFRLRSF